MNIKRLLKHTIILLRTALLLGAATFVNVQQAEGQTLSLTSEMPDAFNTKTPVIGDGQYYYIQFYEEIQYAPYLFTPFLGEAGTDGTALSSMDYLPFAPNRQWTLEDAGNGRFRLKSKRGNYAYLDGSSFKKTSSQTQASTFELIARSSSRKGYYELRESKDKNIGRHYGNLNGWEWADIIATGNNSPHALVRFAQLKSNAAHIIYYREEHADGLDNLDRRANAPTTRHYLTYSNTGDDRVSGSLPYWQSTISTRLSIVPSDKSLWTLPTAAAYHKDGLWSLVEAGSDGKFYIKKYGGSNNEFLKTVPDNGLLYNDLGAQDETYGVFSLETPIANRYTRISQTLPSSEEIALSTNQFYTWNGWLAGSASNGKASVETNLNQSLSEGNVVIGAANVNYLTYADLTGCKKMIFNGTSGTRLRVLMNRPNTTLQPGETGYDVNGGTAVEIKPTIGSDGSAEVDLSAYGYIHLNSIKIDWGSTGSISSVTLVMPKLNTISLAANQFYVWNGTDATATHGETPANDITFHVNDNQGVYATQVVAGKSDASVHYLTYADLTGCTKMIIEGDVGFKPRLLLNRMTDNGATIERIATINSDGKAEVDLSDLPFVHLNAIKAASDYQGSGKVTSITLLSPDNVTRYMHHATGDGWQVLQWSDPDNDYFHAGFYPVEVVDKDEFFMVQVNTVGSESKPGIELNHGRKEGVTVKPLPGSTDQNIIGAEFTPNADYQNVFQYTGSDALSINEYQKLVVRFAKPVDGHWGISGIVPNGSGGWKQGWEEIPIGATYYEMDLSGVTKINDFTVFNVGGERKPISIAECYFYSGTTLNHSGSTENSSEANPILWELEQGSGTNANYQHFTLKNPDTEFTNTTLTSQYHLRWILPVIKEIPVNHYVTHRMSYLKDIASAYSGLDKQGLATGAEKDWWNLDTDIPIEKRVYHLGGGTQKVNQFEITHYIKQGETKLVGLPTVLNSNNDHVYFQRWYNYDENDENMDLNKLKAHVSLDTKSDGDVQYYLYKNGIVTGEKLFWDAYNTGQRRYAFRYFNYTNSDGNAFTVAADVSRYSDYTYQYPPSENDEETPVNGPLDGNLEEPSLTMRYIYYMKDAKEMARNLTAKTLKPETDVNNNNWLEYKELHFPYKEIAYEDKKFVGYRGEFIGLRHLFSDYWVFNGSGEGNNNLVSAVDDGGKIKVVIYDPNETGIRLGGYNPRLEEVFATTDGDDGTNDSYYEGYYRYDMMVGKNSYGDSRFIVFRYPATHEIEEEKIGLPAYVRVYFEANNTKYQLAQFTVIFDANSETLPWTSVNGSGQVKNTPRDPNQLRENADGHEPIAKITFDYPANTTYQYPGKGSTRHDGGEHAYSATNNTIDKSSPIPLTFDKTNYAFDGDNCNWGSYAMVDQKTTRFGNSQNTWPANDSGHGYGVEPDAGLQSGFLYIDASEQPGDICSAPFQGNFCSGSKLMFSGWISGSNKAGGDDKRCPGGVTLTVKGEHTVNGEPKAETLYRFCPSQCYELDDNDDITFGEVADGDKNKYNVVWQQFYFEFTVTETFERHWIEVNNNCVSSNGGDFMLDNIEVFAKVPEVTPEMNTPLCVSVNNDGSTVTDVRLLKLTVDYDNLRSSAGLNLSEKETELNKPHLGFVFLEKEKFLTEFKSQYNISDDVDKIAKDIDDGVYDYVSGSDAKFRAAFDAALIGTHNVWKSENPTTNPGAAVICFKWSRHFESMESYTFYKAVNKVDAVFRYADPSNDKKYLIMNGNFPQLPWKTNTEYYIVPENTPINNFEDAYGIFNICSKCSRASVFKINPPYTILSMEGTEDTNDLEVCQGKVPTLLTDLKGYDYDGNLVPLRDINFDWWLGNATTLATLNNYHLQQEEGNIRLDKALSTLRIYYPEATDLDGIIGHLAVSPNPELTLGMVNYLKKLVDAGELILHQKSISVPAVKASETDPYFYLVACPIHDGYFDKALNPKAHEFVSYFCDEPQGLRMKVGEAAPTLQTGFVPNENGFESYDYEGAGNAVLSIRLAKKEQFETVKHGEATAYGDDIDKPTDANKETTHFLWLPLRNAQVQSSGSTKVIQKSGDENIYLASTNDPTWDKEIYTSMNKYSTDGDFQGSLPIVGKIVQLNAIDVNKSENETENDNNRLCVYFTNNFDVREGYNYTLSLPFQESPGENTCDGTILINLKIVPDYEVWTGAAGNTDWNNDENWRRADGNLNAPIAESTDGSRRNNNELLRTNDLPTESPLKEYVTNYGNYRTAKDRIFRKGFAPLYCTHVLIKSNEWGDAPVLYDALDGKDNLLASPFANLRDQDGWDGTVNDEDAGTTATKATSTPILRYDMQARLYDIWSDTYGEAPNKLLCLQHEKLPLSAGGALEKVSL